MPNARPACEGKAIPDELDPDNPDALEVRNACLDSPRGTKACSDGFELNILTVQALPIERHQALANLVSGILDAVAVEIKMHL